MGKIQAVEKLWNEFFADPSEWLDNRSTKRSGNSPDFVHFSTKEALWIDGRLNPPWIKAKLAELADAPHARGQRVAYQSNHLIGNLETRNCVRNISKEIYLEDLGKLCEKGQLDDALKAVEHLQQQGCCIKSVVPSLLHGCICNKDLEAARATDRLLVKSGLGPQSFLGSLLIRTFGVCGCLVDAWRVFKRIPRPSLLTWNALLAAHIKCEQYENVLQVYKQMCQQLVNVNEHTFIAVLKACTKLTAMPEGQNIHCHVIDSGFEVDVNVGSGLLQMYAKCQALQDARGVFEKLSKRESSPWTAMVDAYVEHGYTEEALELFSRMLEHGTEPDAVLFVNILRGCSTAADLAQGRCIHAEIISGSFETNMYVATSIIDNYIKCEQLEDARSVYNRLPKRDVVTWSLMIAGYVQHGYPEEALQLLEQMQRVGVKPNHVTLVSILQACSDVGAANLGHIVHADMIENGLQIDPYVISGLIDMYAKCGSVEDAHSVFEKSSDRNVVVWSALMTTYVMHNHYASALRSFMAMQQQGGCKPDEVAFTNAISLCNQEGRVDEGCQHFEDVGRWGGLPALEHYTCMTDLLGRAGCLEEAESILQSMPFLSNIAGWVSLLGSCKTYGNKFIGRKCFHAIMTLDPALASSYLLMSSVDSHAGMCLGMLDIGSACLLKAPGKPFSECVYTDSESAIENQTLHSGTLCAMSNRSNFQAMQDGHVLLNV